MTNVMAEALIATLPEGGDPLQRLRALVAKFRITGRPGRRDRRVVITLARRLGVVLPEPSRRALSPALDLPPAAEAVIRRREREWRELVCERIREAVARMVHSPLGRRVALQAKDLDAGARAIRVLGTLGVDARHVDTEALAWAGRLTPKEVTRLFGKDAALLPDEAEIAARFGLTRRQASWCLKLRVKRPALEGGGETPLTAPVMGVELGEAERAALLGDYTEAVARRAAVKRACLGLWGQKAEGTFPAEPSADRWARIAWLLFVGYALPPVIPAERFSTRARLRAELADTGLTVNQLQATLERSRQEVVGKVARLA